ncbi:MAG: ATP-binding protein [Elusimicrobiaceae bacterium]|nr:ATP-binding protein [Elusimicrobiaceae bacterium]
MFFQKPINELTFEDVRNFLKQGVPENTMLDYKLLLPKNNEKFAKTIAAFANSLGGTIVIGVKDEHDKPKPPFNGVPVNVKIRGQIESIIQNYIDPVVFVDIATCKNPKNGNMFVVVNIPQSNLTPHLVGHLKRAYVRTGQASKPETIVHPNNLPWLLDNRRKSNNLRHILIDKGEAHFDNYLRSLSKDPADVRGVCTLLLTPLYPQEPLRGYKDLPTIARKIGLNGTFNTVQDGLILQISKQSTLEINSYGLVMYRAVLEQGGTFDYQRFTEEAASTLKIASEFYKELNFISPLLMRVKLAKVRGCIIKIAAQKKQIIEDYIRLEKQIYPLVLQTGLADFARNVLEEVSWALNLMPDYL